MKFKIVFLLLTILLLSFCSPPEKPIKLRLKTLHYTNNGGESGKTDFYYNIHGLNNKAHWTLLDESRYSENYHTLNDNGDIIVKYREFSDSLISYNHYEYNANHQITKDSFHRSDGIQGVVHYYYSDDGKKEWADCDGMNGWLHADIFYNYDSKDRLESAILKKENAVIGSISYQYDDYGNNILEVWNFEQGFSQTFNYEYEIVDEQ